MKQDRADFYRLAGELQPELFEDVEPDAASAALDREPSMEAIQRLTLEKLHAANRREKEPNKNKERTEGTMKRKKRLGHTLLIAAALCFLTITAVAAVMSPGFQRLLGLLPREEADRAEPISAPEIVTRPGVGEPGGAGDAPRIVLEPTAVINDGTHAKIYFSLSGEDMDPELKPGDLTIRIDGSLPGRETEPRLLGYDKAAKAAAYCVEVDAATGTRLDNAAVEISLKTLAGEKKHREITLDELGSLAAREPETVPVHMERAGEGLVEMGWPGLAPEGFPLPLEGVEWLSISNAGFARENQMDGLRIQFKVNAPNADQYEVWPSLVSADGSPFGGGNGQFGDMGVIFCMDPQTGKAVKASPGATTAGTLYHDWSMGGVTRQDSLAGVRLRLDLVEAGAVARGNWQASFQMPPSKEIRTLGCDLALGDGAVRLTDVVISPMGVLWTGEVRGGEAGEAGFPPEEMTVTHRDGKTQKLELSHGSYSAELGAYARYGGGQLLDPRQIASVEIGGHSVPVE